VRLYGSAAIIRYRSLLEIVVSGHKAEPGRFWHTDAYEKKRWALAGLCVVARDRNQVSSDADAGYTGVRIEMPRFCLMESPRP
jgi:hypothetical protein